MARILVKVAFFLSLLMAQSVEAAQEIFISKEGNDNWSGRLSKPNEQANDGPVATFTRARLLVRKLIENNVHNKPITIYIRGGTYYLQEPIKFGKYDSGSKMSSVRWRSFSGEVVRISGAAKLHKLNRLTKSTIPKLLPEQAKAHVFTTNLIKEGISNFGNSDSGRIGGLYFRDKPMTLARWPNEGFLRIERTLDIEKFSSFGITGDRQAKFYYDDKRIKLWKNESDAWLFGYWFWDWAIDRQKIKKIDLIEKTIELTGPPHRYGYRRDARYYAYNLLSELDMPGEWYLDRTTKNLYFWPPADSSEGALFPVATTLFNMKNVSNFILQGIVFEYSRGTPLIVENGNNVLITESRIQNVGGWGVKIYGENSGVRASTISNTGEGGILLSGGDRDILNPGLNFSENNHIHNYASVERVYNAAISVYGVGQRVANNRIHEGPHVGIQLSGNNHMIELNEVYNVCNETGDVGAFYMGRDWTMRGNTIRNNYFHDISGPGFRGSIAVYLDDAASGTNIDGNIFVDTERAILVGGGRDNTIKHNLFINNPVSVKIDARGIGWMKKAINPGGVLYNRLNKVPIHSRIWREQYPSLANILQDLPAAPKGNKVIENASFGGGWKQIDPDAEAWVTFSKNQTNPEHIGGVVTKKLLHKKIASLTHIKEVNDIPLDKIGNIDNEERKNIPSLKKK